MGNRRDPNLGIVLLEDRFSVDTETDQGATAYLSQYTEAGPMPGTPEPADTTSSWRPQVVGAQSVGLDSYVLEGGFPGRTGASVAIRKTSEAATLATSAYRGWDEPNMLTTWTAPATGFGSGMDWEDAVCVTLPDTGEIVVVATTSTGILRTWRYNPRDETWTDGYNGAGSAAYSDPLALAVDPDTGALLLWMGDGNALFSIIALRSTDKGATWSLYSRAHFDSDTGTMSRFRVAVQPNRAWLGVSADSAGTIKTWASDNKGVSWRLIETNTTMAGSGQVDVAPLKSGGFIVAYENGTINVRKLASAQSSLASATEIETASGAGQSLCTVAVDDDGTVYIVGTQGTTNTDEVLVQRSADEGESWNYYYWGAVSFDTNAAFPILEQTVAACGALFNLHRISGDASIGDSWGLMQLGGWSNVEAGYGATGVANQRYARSGFGQYYEAVGGAAPGGITWLPFDQPEALSWFHNGAGATLSLTDVAGVGGTLDTVAQDSFYSFSNPHEIYNIGQAVLKVVSGGSAASDDIAIIVRVNDGTRNWDLKIRLSAATLTGVDGNGVATSGATVDTTGAVYVRWQVVTDGGSTCKANLWYRSAGETLWRVVGSWSGASLTAAATAATNDVLLWGHQNAAATCKSVWRMVAFSQNADFRYDIDPIASYDDTIQNHPDRVLGLKYGKPLPARGYGSYPTPDATSTDASAEDCGRLAASGGPAYTSQTVRLPVAHTRAMSQVYPRTSPSPSRYWESLDDSEVHLCWDLTVQSMVGGGIALCVLRAWPRQWVLEWDDGAGGWTTGGTLDLALGTGLNATRTGDTFTPRSGTASVAAYIPEGSLVGGYLLVSAGGGTVAREIVANTGGFYSDSASLQRARIRVTGIDGTEDTTTAVIDIVAPNGLMVVYPNSLIQRRRWRVRVDASQVTPSGTYRAGIVGVGRVLATGTRPGRDWTRRLQLNRTLTRDRAGVSAVKRRGPPVEVWEMGWPEGLDLRALRLTTQSPDYIAGTATGMAIGTVQDPWFSLWGVMREALESGEMPSVIVPQLPLTSGTTLLGPEDFKYGRLLSESVGVTNVVGAPGTDEHVRLDGVAWEEIP